jgi:hypothetical protein
VTSNQLQVVDRRCGARLAIDELRRITSVAGVVACFSLSEPAVAQTQAQPPSGDPQALAKQLANPIAALISLPLQSNYDWDMGPDGGGREYKLNIQPVVPVTLNSDWNLISRTVLPFINQVNVVPGDHAQTGFGDTVQSFFVSPQKPTARGWVWGAGPVFLLPTATDGALGSGKWGGGPTLVALKQRGAVTAGLLVNHIWSFAGESQRPSVNSSFIQPFAAYTSPRATTFSVNMENSYDWARRQWTAPVNLMVSQLFRPQPGASAVPIQVQLGYRFYIDKPSGGPTQGFRLSVVALFPR